jgi:hypothetical protein
MCHESRNGFTFKDLREFFEAEGIEYFLNSERNALQAGFTGPFGRFHLQARLADDQQTLLLSSEVPLSAPEHRRLAMADAVARANYGLKFGAFYLDMDDGELGFHVGIPVADSSLSHTQLRHCLGMTAAACRNSVPKFERVAIHDESPEEVFQRRARGNRATDSRSSEAA